MGFRPKPVALWAKIQRLPKRYTIPASVAIIFAVLYGVIFLLEKPVVFSYAGETCVRQLTLFPAIHRVSGERYMARPSQVIRAGDVAIAARAACFTPTQPPREGTGKVSIAPFGGWILRKTFTVTATAPPTVRAATLSKPISVSKPLVIPLGDTDRVFAYRMKARGRQVECTPKEKAISCDLPKLRLAQGKSYSIELTRRFASKDVATVVKRNITTLSAVSVVKTSIKKNETVYAKPRTIDMVFDKKVTKIKPVLYRINGGKRTVITTDTLVNGKKVQVKTSKDLARSADYELVAGVVEASDGSGLEDPYKLAFKTSGGPKVTGVNIGSTGVSAETTVVVTFDQPISGTQSLEGIVRTSGGATLVGRQSTQLLFSVAAVPKCGDFTINLTNSLKSKYNVSGHSGWSFKGRTLCYTVSTIGYSHQGRPINAYYFGSGGTTILYTGAIHGNEVSTYSLMQTWIQELEANARSIPANKSVVVVPVINPDGFASESRYNSRGVDLNRNFATGDWKKDITTVNNTPLPGGGGKSPMSEPETNAIAGLAGSLRPALILSYHSIGGVAAANQVGNSSALAARYAGQSGYSNITGSSGDTFEYSVTGTADDWYAQKLGVASILIELGSHSYHQFERNRNAMWSMVNL